MELVKIYCDTGDAMAWLAVIGATFLLCANPFPNTLLIACARFLLVLYVKMCTRGRL